MGTGLVLHDFFFFETKNITFNAEENIRPFKRLELYLEREIQGM